jgi:hypothetical protein
MYSCNTCHVCLGSSRTGKGSLDDCLACCNSCCKSGGSRDDCENVCEEEWKRRLEPSEIINDIIN